METQRKEEWDHNWWNSSAAKHKQITVIAGMQSMKITTIDKVAYRSKKHFYVMNGI